MTIKNAITQSSENELLTEENVTKLTAITNSNGNLYTLIGDVYV